MCGGIDDAVRDTARRSWKYVECSRTSAASFAAAGRNGAREEWSGGKPDSERVGGRSTLSAVPSSRRSNEHDAAIIAALMRDVV